MKKSLLALAVLGAFAAGTAQAQTNVSIGGVIRAQAKSYKLSNLHAARGAVRATNEFRVDDDFNSRFWLTGTEDLGGGLKALFYVENRFNSDTRQSAGATGAGLADGDTFVGLRGDWGQVTLGKHTWMSGQGIGAEVLTGTNTVAAIPTSALYTYSLFNQMGTPNVNLGAAAPNAYLGYLDITRRTNSITYRSPNFNGFSGIVGVSASGGELEGQGPNATGKYSDGRQVFLAGTYANGPLYLNLAYWDQEAEGRAATDTQQVRFTGTYKFGGFKVGLAADRAEQSPSAGGASTSRTAWAIPVSYAIGNGTVMASFAKAGDRSRVNDSGAKMYTVGYDHALSKRTSVGVFYSRLDNDTNGNYQPFLAGTTFTGSGSVVGATGETASTLALTVHHTF